MKTKKNKSKTRAKNNKGKVDLKEKYYSFTTGKVEKLLYEGKQTRKPLDDLDDEFDFDEEDDDDLGFDDDYDYDYDDEAVNTNESELDDFKYDEDIDSDDFEYTKSDDLRGSVHTSQNDTQDFEYEGYDEDTSEDYDAEYEEEYDEEDFGVSELRNLDDEEEEEEQHINEFRLKKRINNDREFEEAHKKYNDKKRMRKELDILSDYPDNELPIIELYRTYKSYQQGMDAIKNVNFRVEKGEFVFIVGKSGSGKSTLIRLLLREIRPTSGRVYVNGRELTRLHRRKIAKFRRSIGVVFQDFKLLPDRNVYENVAFAQRVIGKPQKEIRRNVPHVLSIVGLSEKQNSFPNELSGGEQQRVALARALVNKPAILLADEPTGNLDPKTAWEIMELLDEINKQGTTVIVVTHNVDIVDAMKKRVIAIENGQIVSDEQRGGYAYED